MRQLECIVWCPRCQRQHFWIFRELVRDGTFTNVAEPEPRGGVMPTHCECGGLLERQPAPASFDDIH